MNVRRIQGRERTEQTKTAYLLKILAFLTNSFYWTSVMYLSKKYDLVHVHSVPDFEVFSAIVPKALGAKIILDIHDVLPELYASKFTSCHESFMFRLLLRLERVSAGFADHVIIANDL